MRQIRVIYSACTCCDDTDVLIDVPDDASPEEIQQLADAAALSDIDLNVYWDDWPPKPPHKHVSIRTERTLRDDAAVVDVCECGYWRAVGSKGHWNPAPHTRVIQ